MVDFIIEVIVDIILEGSIEAVGDKKIPTPVRVICAIVLVLAYCALVGLIVAVGIVEEKWIVSVIGAAVGLLIGWAFWREIKKRRS